MLWHKCAISAECRTIRIAASADMDNWKGHSVFVIRIYIFLNLNGDFELESQLSCGNDTNVPT
jgi:hypothetical protein